MHLEKFDFVSLPQYQHAPFSESFFSPYNFNFFFFKSVSKCKHLNLNPTTNKEGGEENDPKIYNYKANNNMYIWFSNNSGAQQIQYVVDVSMHTDTD